MADTPQEAYHCPSCGGLASVGPDAKRVCGKCGYELGKPLIITPRMASHGVASSKGGMVQRNVGTRRSAEERVAPAVSAVTTVDEIRAERKTDSRLSTDEVVSDDGHKKVLRRHKKRKRGSFWPLIHLGGWSILLMLVVIIVKFRKQDPGSGVESKEAKEAELRISMREEMEEFLTSRLPLLHATLFQYLNEPDWAGRAQFVCNSSEIAPKMSRYYARNRMWKMPAGSTLNVVKANVVRHSEDRPVIEVLFQVNSDPVKDEEGNLLADQPAPYSREVTFMPDGKQWKIDWEALVHYSPDSWSLFQAGSGEGKLSSEFRLFARRTTVRIQSGRPVWILKFYQPREDLSEMWRQDPVPVVVERDSESGRRLGEILERDPGEWEPGQPSLWRDDPKDLRRVRVRLSWETEENSQRILKVDKVLAGNWLAGGYEERFSDQVPASKDGDTESNEVSEARGQGRD